MSEKFVVGQWVTRKGVNWKVKEVRMEGDTLLLEGYGGAYVDDCFPFGWTPGHTYRTTLDGVTATVASTECGKLYGGDSRSKRYAWGWSGLTGLLLGMEKAIEGPHLLPYLADEPPPVAEAATFSEFADADESDDEPDALQSLLAEFVQERNLCDEQIATWQLKLAEWKVAVRKVEQAIEKAKR